MDRPARPDDGSPARLIATMVGIVGILLLGSLAWSAVGALLGAIGSVTSPLTSGRPTPSPQALVVATPSAQATSAAAAATSARPTPTVAPTSPPMATPAPAPIATPAPSATPKPTPAASGRAPWILLPQPPPETHVPPGELTIEARGRGDAPITAIRLELDGEALPVALEQRSESTWRGVAIVPVGAGKHTVHATVVDDQNRTGGFRWTFDAGP